MSGVIFVLTIVYFSANTVSCRIKFDFNIFPIQHHVHIAEGVGEECTTFPLEDDHTLLLSTLNTEFIGAVGLKFFREDGKPEVVKLSSGKFYFPDEKDAFSRIYYCNYGKEPEWHKLRCTDLIVLNLPLTTTQAKLHDYFQTFGKLVYAMIKRDSDTGRSKGFGYIKFEKYDAQMQALTSAHRINGQDVTVEISDHKIFKAPHGWGKLAKIVHAPAQAESRSSQSSESDSMME